MSQSVDEVKAAFVNGVQTATEIADACSHRIRAQDDTYHAMIATDDTILRAQAAQLDALHMVQRSEQLLAGVPILIKDNIETSEWPTTAGSLALATHSTKRDARLVQLLRDAGAMVAGKTNLSEWANFRSEHSTSGWSAVGGQTRNAHDSRRSPCGSSSGSAVAVALGYVPVAIGSETDGSIVCPAAINGVVGFKPTQGLVSGHGIIPISGTQDTAGPIARSVADAAIVLAAIIEPDSTQAREVSQGLISIGQQRAVDAPTLESVRIGVLTNTQGYDSRWDELLGKSLRLLESLGATLVPDLRVTPYKGFRRDSYDVLLFEFKRDLEAYFSTVPGILNGATLKELIAFNEEHAGQELRYFDQSTFLLAENLTLSEDEYLAKLAAIRSATRENGLDGLLEEHHLDALVATTNGPAWLIDEVNGDPHFGPSISSFPAIAGNPHLTIPMGTIESLPMGLSFIGDRLQDHALANIAWVYEATRSVALSDRTESNGSRDNTAVSITRSLRCGPTDLRSRRQCYDATVAVAVTVGSSNSLTLCSRSSRR